MVIISMGIRRRISLFSFFYSSDPDTMDSVDSFFIVSDTLLSVTSSLKLTTLLCLRMIAVSLLPLSLILSARIILATSPRINLLNADVSSSRYGLCLTWKRPGSESCILDRRPGIERAGPGLCPSIVNAEGRRSRHAGP